MRAFTTPSPPTLYLLTYIRMIASEDFYVDGCHVCLQKVQPLSLKANLVHVNVNRRDVLVTTRNTGVLEERNKKNKEGSNLLWKGWNKKFKNIC